MHTCTRILASDLNIFISTGSKTREYKKVLAEEIEAQSLNYNIVEDISKSSEVNAIIYADESDISDFSIFPDDTVIFSIFAGVEKTLLNKTIQQPLVRLIDVEMTECMAEWCTAHVMRYHLDLDVFIKPEKKDLVKGLIYPVPDPKFPFLGVHFTKTVHDGLVEAGPNAVLGWAREAYRKINVNPKELMSTLSYPGFIRFALENWMIGFNEINRSFRKRVFVKDLQKMIPEIKSSDLMTGGAGVRAQAIGRNGELIDDFAFEFTEKSIHVLNAPSPGATSSLVIGKYIANLAIDKLSLIHI